MVSRRTIIAVKNEDSENVLHIYSSKRRPTECLFRYTYVDLTSNVDSHSSTCLQSKFRITFSDEVARDHLFEFLTSNYFTDFSNVVANLPMIPLEHVNNLNYFFLSYLTAYSDEKLIYTFDSPADKFIPRQLTCDRNLSIFEKLQQICLLKQKRKEKEENQRLLAQVAAVTKPLSNLRLFIGHTRDEKKALHSKHQSANITQSEKKEFYVR